METHHRRLLRLQGYDYSQPGAYFVTICTQSRESLFGCIVGEEMRLNDAARMIERWWAELPRKFPRVEVDAHMVMPNHFHGIIVIADTALPVGADLRVRPNRAAGAHIGAPLPQIMQWFKTMTTNTYIGGVKQHGWPRFSEKLWQRGYYEHVIRREDEFNQIRQYILMNPAQWAWDRQNPSSKLSSAPEAPWQL